MKIITEIPLLAEILASWRKLLGGSFAGYANHCYRVFNFCAAFSPGAADQEAAQGKIALAAAFHDLGIWTDNTFDYLVPSAKLARAYLCATGREGWEDEIAAMIANHHKVTPYRGNPLWLAEAFRRADWVDVSLGSLNFGLPKHFVRGVRRAYPNAGFHGELAALIGRRLRTHPLSPLPMLKL